MTPRTPRRATVTVVLTDADYRHLLYTIERTHYLKCTAYLALRRARVAKRGKP
jgi:hypothetical protein